MDMRTLLEAMNKFSGEASGQKPGDQVRGTEKAKPTKSGEDHPFKGRLVGAAESVEPNMLKGLQQVAEEKSLEWELAEAYANFLEADLGVEPKRPARAGSRHSRGHEPVARYKTVKEYKKDTDNFTADDIKELENIKDLATLKARAFQLISTPSKRPMKPEKVAWFKQVIDSKTNPTAVIKLMWDLLLSGEGHSVVGSRSSMDPNSYRRRFSEEDQGASKAKETEFHKKLDTLVHDTFGKRKEEMEESAENLNVGDDVIITGPVEHKGETGVIDSFGQDKRFVVVNLYNHGKKSFHSSDVSYNDYAGSDEEEAEMYDRDPEFRDWAARQDVAEGKLWRVAYSVEDERYGTPYDDKVFDNPGEAQGHVYNIKRAAELAGQEVPVIGYQWFYPEEVDEDKVGSWVVHKDGKFLGRFATRKGAKAHAEKHGATVASSEYYNDHVKKVEEGWGAETAEKRHREQMSAVAKVLQKYKDNPEQAKLASYMFQNNWNAQAIEREMSGQGQYSLDWWKNRLAKAEQERGPQKDWTEHMAAEYLQNNQSDVNESQGDPHKILLNKLRDIERKPSAPSGDDDARRAEQAKADYAKYVAKMKKKDPNFVPLYKMDEAGTAIGSTAKGGAIGSTAKGGAVGGGAIGGTAKGGAVGGGAMGQKAASALNTFKAATGASAPAPNIANALDKVSQGGPASASDMKILEPVMKDLATVATDPKLANQFKTLAGQVNQTQQQQQQQK